MFVIPSNSDSGTCTAKRARANAFCSMHVFSRVYAVRGQKKLMFPKGYCVTVRHDFDNESTGRREVVAIFKNRSCVPRGASNPRQAHREKLPSRSQYGRFTFHISLLLFCPPARLKVQNAKGEILSANDLEL